MEWKHLARFLLSGSSMGEPYAILLVRLLLGLFFGISGANKLFVASDRENIYQTLVKAKIPFPRGTARFVAGVEFICGGLLALGFLSKLASMALLIDMVVAALTVSVPALPKALSPVKWFDDLLYLPEVLYALFFIWLLCAGSGRFSVDYFILNNLVT